MTNKILVNELEHELIEDCIELELGVLVVVAVDVQVDIEVVWDLGPIDPLVQNLNLILVVDLDTFEIVLELVDNWLEFDVNQIGLVLRYILLLDLPWLDIVVGVVVVVVHIDEVLDDVDMEVVAVLAIELVVLDVVVVLEILAIVLVVLKVESCNVVANLVVDELAIGHVDVLEDLVVEVVEIVIAGLVGLDLVNFNVLDDHRVVNHVNVEVEMVDFTVDGRVPDYNVLDMLGVVHPFDDLDVLLLVIDVDENALSPEEVKERRIMKLLLKIKNGTPPMRKSALRQITDRAREFGAGPLLNQILPLLMSPTLEDQERHLLVKVIDRILYKLDDLVRPYVHKILVVIEPLLIDEDYYARVEGREIISNLAKAAGLATMISTMRPDIDNIDEYVRNTTARAFAVVATALGIPSLLPFLKAVCRSKKSWQARHTGIKDCGNICI